ncbi:sodium:proton antiporter [Marinomonas sp. SBI22]|uniref:Na+/H+ antiporter NhaC n=1 Tax=unclassified Marinomonas TaxID=196814 RepID=UPI0007AF5748|nr:MULTISPECIES: Na+/H+ antiporter NhaC [unclassified Marinomonas]KZM45858.1 sodium:proton antiporter [Marinomonas sp. SBI22]KZM46376.1 sodium:proton antiporter [Marinomonas sp. SBI8L]
MSNQLQSPSFRQSFLTFGAIVCVIGVGLFYLKASLHSLMLICLLIASISALKLSQDGFKSIRNAMNSGIQGALSAIYIFILIGVLIAAFIQSGTVAALIYYGLEIISPALFLPAGLILCSFMSVATGTSWGTVGTAGVVLMGIGEAMGIPLPLVAGVVVSGACFGDKMSPVSDTTNLAAMSSGTDLYTHIKGMLYTTGPAYLVCLVVFSFMGMSYAEHGLPASELNAMLAGIENTYSINLICLLPFVVMLVMSLKKISAEVAMMSAAVVAVLIAILMQGAQFTTVLNSLFSGGSFETGISTLDKLFSRGGISSMMWTLSLALMALALGGILSQFGFLRVLISSILSRVKRAASLVTTTILSCFLGNMSMGEAYMSIILGGQLFGDAYDKHKLDRSLMSRSLEEGATLTTALIPWTTGGAFFASTLGVSVLDYAPYALLNWFNPLLSILLAYLGIALFRAKTSTTEHNNQTQTDDVQLKQAAN